MEPGPAPGFFVSEIRGLGRVVRLQPSKLPTPVRSRLAELQELSYGRG